MLNFSIPSFTLCQEKTLYHQRYSTDFQRTFLLLKDVENRYLGENFMSAAILVLELHGENFFQVEKFEIKNPTFKLYKFAVS